MGARPSSFRKTNQGQTYELSQLARGLLDRMPFTKYSLRTSERKKKQEHVRPQSRATSGEHKPRVGGHLVNLSKRAGKP